MVKEKKYQNKEGPWNRNILKIFYEYDLYWVLFK